MPRRKIPTASAKTDAEIESAIREYRSPAALKHDRLQRFLPSLVARRREGAPWHDIVGFIEDADHRFTVAEVKEVIEPLVDDQKYPTATSQQPITTAVPHQRPAGAPAKPTATEVRPTATKTLASVGRP